MSHPTMLRSLPLLFLLASCAQFPDLDDALPEHLQDADFPRLIPLSGEELDPARSQEERADTVDALNARIAALNARANRLRRPVLAQSTHQRMANGISKP